MNRNRSVLWALAACVPAIGAGGCKSSPVTTDAPAIGASANESATTPTTQEADPSVVTDVGPTAATDPLPLPPAPKVEDEGPAPSDHHVWLNGYWWWDASQTAYSWSPGVWQDRTLETTLTPPETVYEDPGRAPNADYTYLPGYWNWSGSRYVWYHGYWGPHRDGFAYVHPFWENVGGHWRCASWGWERYDAAWEGRHAGWEFHGGVWERPADYRLRVTVAGGHAGDFRVTPGTWHGHVYGRADVDVHSRGVGAVGAFGTMHAGDRFAEPVRRAAAHPRMGGPGEPRTQAQPRPPAQERRQVETRPGAPERQQEPQPRVEAPEHGAGATPREPERRPEPQHTVKAPEHGAGATPREPERRPETQHTVNAPEHRVETPHEPAAAPEHKVESVRRTEPKSKEKSER